MLDRTAPFLLSCGERLFPFTFLCLKLQRGLTVDVEIVRRAHRTADDGCLCAVCDGLQAPVQHAIAEVDEVVLSQLVDCGFAFAVRGEAVDGDEILDIRIDKICGRRPAFEIDQTLFDPLDGRPRGAPVSKLVRDLRLDHIRVDIADEDQRGIVRSIIPAVEFPHHRARGGIDVLYSPVGTKPLGIERLGRNKLEVVLEAPDGEIVARSSFGLDDAALTVDGFVGNGELRRGLAHQHQRRIDEFVVHPRQVELVDCVFEASRGVGIRSERETEAFQKLDHLALGYVGRPVESHVFDDMGEAQFIVAFINPADVEAETYHCGVLRRLVPQDRIFHPIGQDAETYICIGRHIVDRDAPRGFATLRGSGRYFLRFLGHHAHRCGKRQQRQHGKRAGEIFACHVCVPNRRRKAATNVAFTWLS